MAPVLKATLFETVTIANISTTDFRKRQEKCGKTYKKQPETGEKSPKTKRFIYQIFLQPKTEKIEFLQFFLQNEKLDGNSPKN